MADLKSIMTNFNEAIAEVAMVWKNQQSGFTDKKLQEFGTYVLRPVSNTGAQLNLQAKQLDNSLKKLHELDLITFD